MNQLQQRFLDQLRSQQQGLQELLIEALFAEQEGTAKQELPKTTATLLKSTANGRRTNPALGMAIDRYVQNTKRFKYADLHEYLKDQGYGDLGRYTIKYPLDKLRDAGKLEYVGPGTKGFYEYKEKEDAAIPSSKLRKITKKKVQANKRWKFMVDSKTPAAEQVKAASNGHSELWNDIVQFAKENNGEIKLNEYPVKVKQRLGKEVEYSSIASTIGQLAGRKVLEKVGDRHYRLR